MSDELMLLPPHVSEKVIRAAPVKGSGLYADWPGTGPAGETCGSCARCYRAPNGRYRKCELVRALWSGGTATDIKARSAACSKWEAA